jgi:hypothetical protein
MSHPTRRAPRAGLARAAVGALAIAGVVSGAALGASPSTMPAAPPTDAKLAKMTTITTVVTPNPTVSRGVNGFQTVIVSAPPRRSLLQGFATMGGGQTGSVLIRSTQVAGRRFIVHLTFPGEQGTPGRLYVRIQTVPSP